MKRTLSIMALLATASFAQPTVAQEAKRPAGTLERRDPARALESFLSSRSQAQGERAARLESRGAGADLRELNGLVRAVSIAAPQPAAASNDDLRRRLSDAFLVDVAQFLAIHGVKPGDVRRSGDGAAIVEAAARIIRGSASLSDYQRFADISFVGELQNVANDPQPTGNYRSTALIRVVTPLKGQLQPGSLVAVRQTSGRDGDSIIRDNSDLQQGADGQYLIMASKARLLNTSSGTQATPANREDYAYVVVPLRTESGAVLPTSMFPSTSVSSLVNR